jgi:hypothetical protein
MYYYHRINHDMETCKNKKMKAHVIAISKAIMLQP